MRVALCATFALPGRAEDVRIGRLQRQLLDAGHQVETVRLPWSRDPAVAFRHLTACRWIDLQSGADRILCLGPPAHAIPHACKVAWLERECFDEAAQAPDVALPARGLLDAVGALHAAALRECRHVFVTPGRSGAGPAQIAGITALRLDAPPCGADQEVDRDREGWSAVVRRLLS